MKQQLKNWSIGPYPWLIITLVFLLMSLRYWIIKNDLIGSIIFFIVVIFGFINFLGRTKKWNKK